METKVSESELRTLSRKLHSQIFEKLEKEGFSPAHVQTIENINERKQTLSFKFENKVFYLKHGISVIYEDSRVFAAEFTIFIKIFSFHYDEDTSLYQIRYKDLLMSEITSLLEVKPYLNEIIAKFEA